VSEDKTRSYIDKAHLEFERLKQSQSASGTAQDGFNQGVLETLHQLIHALDSIEKRLAPVREPVPQKIATLAAPIVRREAERARALIEQGRGRVLSFRQRIGDSMKRLTRKSLPSARRSDELERELAELKGDVRLMRDTMEALRKRLESMGPLHN